jgi:hypothetical protein
MTPEELAWLSGLFEGEGCIGLSHEGRPTLQLSMVDEDVVRHAHALAGVGKVKSKQPGKGSLGRKLLWTWSVGRCDEAAALLERMLPFFGGRRSARAREVLASYAATPAPKRLRTHCIHGHPFSGDNLALVTWNGRVTQRRCRKCAVVKTQKCRDRKAARLAVAV